MNGSFILTPGEWLGEGMIAFNTSPDRLRFFTKWTVALGEDPETMLLHQQVEMAGAEEKIHNRFVIRMQTMDKFAISLQNELLGTIYGTGFLAPSKVAWEFRGHPSFEGFEVYEEVEGGGYQFHAEYLSPDQMRSMIDGRIWLKQS